MHLNGPRPPHRYFKGHARGYCYFRRTRTKHYRSLIVRDFSFSFSSLPPGEGRLPVTEITADEFHRLLATRDVARSRSGDAGRASASECWVEDADLPMAAQ